MDIISDNRRKNAPNGNADGKRTVPDKNKMLPIFILFFSFSFIKILFNTF
tara:strand:- start:306 stop:455 length:150 start_codon:yes stop_codon:yes gene_type:complete